MNDNGRAQGMAATGLATDIQRSPLYREAEEIFRNMFQPGSGRPSAAMEVAVSPDGKHVAFSGTTIDRLEGPPATRIFMADLQSGALRILSTGPNSDLTPRFSPDGRFLAFRSDRAAPGNFQAYLIDLHQGTTRATPTVDGWVESLEFSPNGSRLLLVVAGFGADAAAIQGAKTSKRVDADAHAAWMPSVDISDETFRRRTAWTVDLRARSARAVSPGTLNIWEACWCGNDAIAAIASAGSSEGHWYQASLVGFKTKAAKAEVLYQPKDQLGWLSASPDGRHLAIVEAVCSDRGLCAGDVRIVEVATGKVHRIESAIDATATVWRDNTRVLVAGIRDLSTLVAEVDTRTGSVRECWRSEELYSPSPLYPHAAPCSPEGFVMAVHGHLRPMQLLHVSYSQQRAVLSLGHSGLEAIADKLRAVRPYSWQSRDGQEMQGWLMRGPGRRAAPLIMEVHGGPIWRSSPFFLGRSAYYAMLAERGYAFFWPNPRGSTGRGQEFARAVAGDMGGADAQDCLSGLDQLVADGTADAGRLGVMGNSYGGFLSAWMITQDQRFAAAIASCPITDWVSQHLTTNIPTFDLAFLGRYTDNCGSNHHARSPVMFAHWARTPTLNICGALDRCSPPGQAQQFHNALVEHGVPSVLVTYPLEGHGVRSFPAMIDHSARVVDWFTRYMATAETH